MQNLLLHSWQLISMYLCPVLLCDHETRSGSWAYFSNVVKLGEPCGGDPRPPHTTQRPALQGVSGKTGPLPRAGETDDRTQTPVSNMRSCHHFHVPRMCEVKNRDRLRAQSKRWCSANATWLRRCYIISDVGAMGGQAGVGRVCGWDAAVRPHPRPCSWAARPQFICHGHASYAIVFVKLWEGWISLNSTCTTGM